MKIRNAIFAAAVFAAPAGAVRLTVANYSAEAVPAASVTVERSELARLGLPPDGQLRAALAGIGAAVPVATGTRNGKPVVRFFLGLSGGERAELDVEPALGAMPDVAQVEWDRARHEGTASNGVVQLRMRGNRWDLLFAGHGAEAERTILFDGGYYGWLDDRRRGRVSDTRAFDPARDDSRDPGAEGAGMISTRTARIASSTADVKPNGDIEIRIAKRFDGFAQDVLWTEIYTLVAGLPLLRYQTRFENRGNAPVYVAYVGRGGWVYARYGAALARGPRLYSDQKGVNDLPAGGQVVRIAWVPEHTWAGLESDSGIGVAASTLHDLAPNLMQGSMVWQFGASSFSLPLVESRQGQYPWLVSPGENAESGIAFLATAGGTPVASDGRALLRALNRKADVEPLTSYAVLASDRVLQAASVNGPATLDAAPLIGAVEVDFAKSWLLDVTADRGVAITAEPMDGRGGPVALGTTTGGRTTIDLGTACGWTGVRRFVLRASAGIVRQAALRRKPFDAPPVISPRDDVSITDLAFYFKWRAVPDARGYELELARDGQFQSVETAAIKGVTHYIPERLPDAGRWFWRVRAIAPGIEGAWSPARSVTVNQVHGKAPLVRVLDPENPLFTIEAGDGSDFTKLSRAIPDDIKRHFAVVIGDKENLPKLLAPARERNIAVMLRTHHPSAVDGWTPLADVEAAFRDFPNVIGVQGGESLGSWYGGGENARYIQRLVGLAVKYGRLVHEGDGCYDENKWKEVYDDPASGRMLRENSRHIVFSQKNNIFNKQLMTQSAVLGQYLAGAIANSGAWEDGGWYWAQVGFRKLGEAFGARSGRLQDMPSNFWNLTFLMGVARGATVYSMDGQGGVFIRGHYDPANPAHRYSALWSGEGQQTETFQRYVLPFLRAVVAHNVIPSREQVLANVKLAVTLDGAERVTSFHDDRYREFWALYAGTYGYRAQGPARGEVYEYFPNTGRYFYIPILPPGARLPVATAAIGDLQDPEAVRALFDRRYPKWYEGDALVTLTGDTLAVLNTRENEDIAESYSVPVQRGRLRRIAGQIAVHSYLMGKFEDSDRRLWLQANTNYPQRDTRLVFTADREPGVSVQPAGALKSRAWDAARNELALVLSHEAGAVEVNLEIAR